MYRLWYPAALTLAVGVSALTVWPFIRNKSLGDQYVQELSTYIRTQLPIDAPVAVYGIGEIAFASQHPIAIPEALPVLERFHL